MLRCFVSLEYGNRIEPEAHIGIQQGKISLTLIYPRLY